MEELKPEIKIKSIDQLIPYANNSRTHTADQIAEIASSIKEFGFTNPVLLDKDNGVIAGHGRIDAAKLLGLKEIPTISLEHLTEAQKKAYIIADNRIAMKAGWNDEMLAIEISRLRELDYDLKFTGLTDEDIERIEVDVERLPDGDEDEVPELKIEATTKLGDVWILGQHRLMCGDSTSIDAVDKLMMGEKADMVFTDPPYGVNYTGGAKKREALANDRIGTEIYGQALPLLRSCAKDHAALYLWYADAHASSAAAAAAAAAAGYVISAQIIWVKNNAQFVSSAKYHGKHEPCFYAHRKGKAAQWFGKNNEVTVWEVDRNAKNEFHPTQKPTALAERAIENSSQKGNIILDLFGGSGSTLIACEKTNRKCFMLEISPAYCDVIVKRFQQLSGKKAIHEKSQKTFDEISPLI